MTTFLTPDRTITAKVGGETITIKQKIIPDNSRAAKDICSYIKKGDLVKPQRKVNDNGEPRGITVHNTDLITPANGTNPAEQYARATFPNGNMSGVVVHYWVWKSEIWQQLDDSEQGWHAADGTTRRTSQRAGQRIGGNVDTISIEVIETGENKETEATAAKLVAYLLNKHNLSPDTDIYTHNYFYSKKYCPAYILPRWSSFVNQCKAYFSAIGGTVTPVNPAPPTPAPAVGINPGDVVKIAGNAVYYDGKSMPDWVKADSWIVHEVKGDRAVIDRNVSGKNAIMSPVNVKFLSAVSGSSSPPAFTPYLVKIVSDTLNYRSGAGANYDIKGQVKKGEVYTIVGESNGWGKLKSGAGWVNLTYTEKYTKN